MTKKQIEHQLAELEASQRAADAERDAFLAKAQQEMAEAERQVEIELQKLNAELNKHRATAQRAIDGVIERHRKLTADIDALRQQGQNYLEQLAAIQASN